jgi:pimeloyl-ACP methyl ester carboxylesterase
VDKLKGRHRLLMFDFLGFGDSDKPIGHRYSLFEQADITEALWRHFDVENTGLVAHDYGDTVALELLRRQQEGKLVCKIEKLIMMNGGVYVDFQRPLLIQKLLQKPIVGTFLSRLIRESTFKRNFSSIFSKPHPISETELQQHWQAITHHDGLRNYHRIIRYLSERRKYKSRWEKTLESREVPMRFLWGLEDPVSGRNISQQIGKRIPDADLLELEDVGHYPQLEVPDLISEEILKTFYL